ncbi:ZYRO0B04686p [Zygosaccharomyces rouxii]|uniref:ZYRO0B04686p n=1 Tax=Zygosaccharomyces rouxii (strain ATCC 2623 / CBS 732 / NBRC 1130 / NCYC 568 / NRRL Y-229) TaxID=559307 RepID=C5DR11_ZYGRC|nr:uncharacterized protein ZYRO0B04686g [Zygosaccharomyces rouxii]KAH9200232.1 Scd6-like Sm domain-containing protein [Zygosaccharomyces rouxii]CAR26222.1 ZYRO0B04686p [Zygosaccharomyces rouxii]
MSQYIGKTISLVSVTENRYVGLLEGIDSEKGTVTLGDVRCFGTEGRKGWGPEEIYPNATVYRSVKFNGNEVKDLSILDMKLEDVQPVMAPQPQPNQFQNQMPAAVAGYGVYAPAPNTNGDASGAEQPSQQTSPSAPSATTATTVGGSASTTQQQQQQHQQQQQKQPQQQQIPPQQPPVASTAGPGVPPAQRVPAEDAQSVQGMPEFDFQGNNAKFAAPSAANATSDTFYNKKSSFFDSISTSTEVNTNMRWQEEKVMNMDTFGQASARPRFTGRGGRRGRGGGRGGFRGRGGGYRGKIRQNSNRGNSGDAHLQNQQQQHGSVEF